MPIDALIPAHIGTYALPALKGRTAHIESRMSRSWWVGWTGLGWAIPGGGRLVLGHTAR